MSDTMKHARSPCRHTQAEKPLSLIRYVADRPGHDRRYAIDARRAEHELGFTPQVNLEEGLRDTVAWYLQNRVWWERIQTGEYRSWYERNYASRFDQSDVDGDGNTEPQPRVITPCA